MFKILYRFKTFKSVSSLDKIQLNENIRLENKYLSQLHNQNYKNICQFAQTAIKKNCTFEKTVLFVSTIKYINKNLQIFCNNVSRYHILYICILVQKHEKLNKIPNMLYSYNLDFQQAFNLLKVVKTLPKSRQLIIQLIYKKLSKENQKIYQEHNIQFLLKIIEQLSQLHQFYLTTSKQSRTFTYMRLILSIIDQRASQIILVGYRESRQSQIKSNPFEKKQEEKNKKKVFQLELKQLQKQEISRIIILIEKMLQFNKFNQRIDFIATNIFLKYQNTLSQQLIYKCLNIFNKISKKNQAILFYCQRNILLSSNHHLQIMLLFFILNSNEGQINQFQNYYFQVCNNQKNIQLDLKLQQMVFIFCRLLNIENEFTEQFIKKKHLKQQQNQLIVFFEQFLNKYEHKLEKTVDIFTLMNIFIEKQTIIFLLSKKQRLLTGTQQL